MAKPIPKSAAPKPAAKKPTTADNGTGIPPRAAAETANVVQHLDPRRSGRLAAISRDIGGMPPLQLIGAAVVEELAFINLDAKSEFPQELLQAAFLLERIEKSAKKLTEVIEAAAVQHFKAGKSFQRGRYAATIELDKPGRKTPKWKEIAIKERTALCEKLSIPFDVEAYEKAILAVTDPSKKDAVTIVETA